MVWLRNCLVVLVLGLSFDVWADTKHAEAPFSPKEWQQAVQLSTKDWSRENLLHRFTLSTTVSGTDRPHLIALLGEPGYAAERYVVGDGFKDEIDMYRLSSKNDRTYVIRYGADHKATSDDIEDLPCACPLCDEKSPIITLSSLNETTSHPGSLYLRRKLNLSELEAMVGQPGHRSFSNDEDRNSLWVNYGEVWRLSRPDHRFLVVQGSKIAKDWTSDVWVTEPVRTYSLITLKSQCLMH